MNNIANRFLVVLATLCMSVATVISAPLLSSPASALDPASTVAQSITGGGIGDHSGASAPLVLHSGYYSTSGQLGHGQYVFEDGDADGAAAFVRADGMRLDGTTSKIPGQCGAIPDSTYCLVVVLDGSGDIDGAVLHLVMLVDFGKAGRSSFLMTGQLQLNRRVGYAMIDATGTTYAFGGIDRVGDAHTASAVDLELTPSKKGYWIANASGQVYALGDARFFGNANGATFARGEAVTSMSATPTGKGYWLFTSKGRALTFGDAKFLGDLVSTPLQGGVVGSVATPTGKGYYMVGRDGGVFAFGDAKFRGSMGNARLNQPVVGLVPTRDNTGYWLVAADGGIFSFNAPFLGSLGALRLNRPIVAMVAYGNAYLMVASDGGVFNFSRNTFFGSQANTRLAAPIVNAAAAG